MKDIATGAVDCGVNSRTGQIRYIIANAVTFLRSCAIKALSRGDGPTTSYTLRRNTSSITKI